MQHTWHLQNKLFSLNQIEGILIGKKHTLDVIATKFSVTTHYIQCSYQIIKRCNSVSFWQMCVNSLYLAKTTNKRLLTFFFFPTRNLCAFFLTPRFLLFCPGASTWIEYVQVMKWLLKFLQIFSWNKL